MRFPSAISTPLPRRRDHPDATSPAPEPRRGAWWYGPFPPGGARVHSIRRYLALPASVLCTAVTLYVLNQLVVPG